MDIVPVIDIRNGEVVRASGGKRAHYRPIVTPLAATSAPIDVAAGFLRLHSFKSIYVADLDAIEGHGDNRTAILELRDAFPQTCFMIDAGAGFRDFRGLARVDVVIGSESLRDEDAVTLRAASQDPHIVLSLDFREGFLGPGALLFSPALWPKRVIVMTLARVGAGGGPDVVKLAHIRAAAGDRKLYAAGGVRGVEDLKTLRQAGAAGALVASALHDGRLTSGDLARLGANA
jgi:phosphoribosylformimino-5-aminoimidazole carboxamide ribotide isomerase